MPRRANCAMTWDDNRHRICAVGGADGADGARASDTPRDLGIRSRLAGRNRAQLFPDRKLKWSSADIHRRRRHLASGPRRSPRAHWPTGRRARPRDDSGLRPESSHADSRRAARRPASNLLRPSQRSRCLAACLPPASARAPNRQSRTRLPRRRRPARTMHSVNCYFSFAYGILGTYNPADRLM